LEVERERLAREIRRTLFIADTVRDSEGEILMHIDASKQNKEMGNSKSAQLGGGMLDEDRVVDDSINNSILKHRLSDQKDAGDGRVKEPEAEGVFFGRSISDIFNHSWRASRASKWCWIAKPITLGGGICGAA
jgi:hypothetical protein